MGWRSRKEILKTCRDERPNDRPRHSDAAEPLGDPAGGTPDSSCCDRWIWAEPLLLLKWRESNEINESGDTRSSFISRCPGVPAEFILERDRQRLQRDYDTDCQTAHGTIPSSALLGIGADGHTWACLLVPVYGKGAYRSRQNIFGDLLHDGSRNEYGEETHYNDHSPDFRWWTFHHHSLQPWQREQRLKRCFQDGSEEDIPARVLQAARNRAMKTLLITDQRV